MAESINFDPSTAVPVGQSNGFAPSTAVPSQNFDPLSARPLGDALADDARQKIEEYHAGNLDLSPETYNALNKVASNGKSPLREAGDAALAIGKGIANFETQPLLHPVDTFNKVKSAASDFGSRFQKDYAERANFDPQLLKDMAGGAATGITNLATSALGFGHKIDKLSNYILMPKGAYERSSAAEDPIFGNIQHNAATSNRKIDELVGANPQSTGHQAGELASQAVIPGGAEAKGAEAAARIGEGIVEGGAKAAGIAAQTVGKTGKVVGPAVVAAELATHGHPILAAGELVAGYGPEGNNWRSIYGIARGINHAVIDSTFGNVDDLGKMLTDSNYGEPLLKGAQRAVEDHIGTLKNDLNYFSNLNPQAAREAETVSAENLSGQAKKIADIKAKIDKMQGRYERLGKFVDVNKVLSSAAKFAATSAVNVGEAGAIGGALAYGQAAPGDTEAIQRGTESTAALGATFAPFAAASGMHDLRMTQGRDALAGRGSKIVAPKSLEGLTDAQKTNVLTTAGAAGAVGVKTVVLSPEEYAKMTAPQRPEVIPAVEGAPQEPQQVNQQAPNGHYDPNTKTIYLNRDAVGEGTAGHELQHPLQQLWGTMLRESDPSWVKTYDELLAKTGQQRTTSSQSERDAEVGRVLLQNTPIEAFYGGESGADVVKRVASNLLQKIAPDRYAQTVGTTDLGAPYSRGDLGEMSQRMFRLGEEAAKPSRTVPSEPQATSTSPGEQTQPTATTQAPAKPVEQVVGEVEQIAKPKVIPVGGVNPQDAVDFLVKMGQTKESAIAKAHAAVQDLKGEGTPVTLENIVKKAMQRSIPKPLENVVSEVDQAAKSTTPKTDEEPSRTPTETVPQETTEPAPERGVADEIQAPAEQADHPDYKAIGAEAETTRRKELAGTRRKTKEQEISRAGLEAMAQAHAEHVDDPDLVTWRTNKYGKSSISGRKLDPNDPFHAHLLEQANLSPEDVKKLNFIESNIGKTLTADYLHAPEEEEASGVSRKSEQAESGAPERVSGEAASRRLSKSFVPTSFTFNAPSKTFEVNGFSPDKFLNNAQMLIPWAKANGLKAWKDINDPSFAKDFQNGVENHKNGYTLAGKPIEGTPLTRVKPNPDYEPHVLSKDKADLLNAMMGDTSARVVERKQAPYREAAKADKQILAAQNSSFWEPQIGETNKIRSMLGDNSNLLESTFETLRPELIQNPRVEAVNDEHTLRPSGFKGDRRVFSEQGLPNSTFSASGFMPATPKPLEVIAKQNGLIYNGEMEGKLHLFSDPQSKTTFSVSINATPEQLQKKLEVARKRMSGEDIQFMPSANPRAIKEAAVKMPDNKIFSYFAHPLAYAEALSNYPTNKLAEWLDNLGEAFAVTGFLTNDGEFLTRDQALQRGKELKQFDEKGIQEAKEHFGDLRGGSGLEALNFLRARKFSLGGVVARSPLSKAKVKSRAA